MSWQDIIKADNVVSNPSLPKAWYDGKETWVNLSRIKDLEDFIESDLHETIHQATVSEINKEIQTLLTEETKYLQDSPELYSVSGGTVRPKKQLYDSLMNTIGKKIASHLAFTEIVTLLQTDSFNLNSMDERGDDFTSMDLFTGYYPQFTEEFRRTHYKWIYRNMVVGASNALGTDKHWAEIATDRDKDRHSRLKNRFSEDIGQMASQVLIDTLALNENWDNTIDFSEDRTETIGESKERLKKSWEGVLKNIQISGQKTSSRDYVLPDDDNCCELLKDIIRQATDYDINNPYGDGFTGVPTFLDTYGNTPDDDYFDRLDKTTKEDILRLLNKTGDAGKEWNSLKNLWDEASKYALNYRDSCDKIVDILHKWSDRKFIGWKFYEDWVYPFVGAFNESETKQMVDRDYDKYLVSYSKVWHALYKNNCDSILIQSDWMRFLETIETSKRGKENA